MRAQALREDLPVDLSLPPVCSTLYSMPSHALLLVSVAVIGVVVAASPGLSLYWCAGIPTIAGLLIGLDSAQQTLTGKDRFGSLSGSGISIYFLLLFVMGWSKAKDRHGQ